MGEATGGPRLEVVAVIHNGPDLGTDSATFLPGLDTYALHVGSGLGAVAARRGERALTVPRELLERLCWLHALALEHDDARHPGGDP